MPGMANHRVTINLFSVVYDFQLAILLIFIQIYWIHYFVVSASSIPPSINLSDQEQIRESVVLPSVDSEREAKELYDKALKQYGSFGPSVQKICGPWILRGCQCTGSYEEITLLCRGVGFEEIPLDIPSDVIKL